MSHEETTKFLEHVDEIELAGIEQVLRSGLDMGDVKVVGQTPLGEDIYDLTEQGRLKVIEQREQQKGGKR